MAGMDISEKRLPQDGSIRFKVKDEEIDLRVSTLPIMHGESIDIRLLHRRQMLLGLEELGLPSKYLSIFENLIIRPHGIILVTGPTGHGKTTTLYACLNKINSIDKKIITVEEPVEYQLKGINQVSVHNKINLTFDPSSTITTLSGKEVFCLWIPVRVFRSASFLLYVDVTNVTFISLSSL